MVRGSWNLCIFDLSEYVRPHFAECSVSVAIVIAM